MRPLTGLVAALVALCLASGAALACACCSDRGHRYVAIEKTSEPRLREIAAMTFDEEAALATGTADAPEAFRTFGTTFKLAVARTDTEIVFTFRSEAGDGKTGDGATSDGKTSDGKTGDDTTRADTTRAGKAGETATLTLVIPDTISIFHVDPRSGVPDEGLGPLLYLEWQLTSQAVGTGVFGAFVGPGQKLSLILHGRGHGCIEAGHFTDWTLLIEGPAGELQVWGALTSAFR
ncbi:MAG: hypothetical protein U1E21_01360 [Reyranellaceae bacterium]